MHFALDLFVGHDQRSRIGIGYTGTFEIIAVLTSSPARFDLFVKAGLRSRDLPWPDLEWPGVPHRASLTQRR